MDDKTLQRKLDQLAKLANALDDEAKRRYGEQAMLFFEAAGSFHIMKGDSDGSMADRTAMAVFSSDYCCMGAGAW